MIENETDRRGAMTRPMTERHLLDSEEESDEESDLLEGGRVKLNDGISDEDSDVTIDDWHNEIQPSWQATGSNLRPSGRRQRLTKPMPAHVTEDDF